MQTRSGRFRRRRGFVGDIREDLRDLDRIDPPQVAGLLERQPDQRLDRRQSQIRGQPRFEVRDGRFAQTFPVTDDGRTLFWTWSNCWWMTALDAAKVRHEIHLFLDMVQLLVDDRFAVYEPRLKSATPVGPAQPEAHSANGFPFRGPTARSSERSPCALILATIS